LTENKRKRSVTHSIFFKKCSTKPNQQIQVRIIYRDSPNTIQRKLNLQKTKRATILATFTLIGLVLFHLIDKINKKE